jgi:aryl-alcohol dehydrogenase-like predicted oxidoreductase
LHDGRLGLYDDRMTIAKQPFGHTGHLSTRVIFGAAALWAMPQDRADRVLDLLFEYGVNHIDTAASYGDAELRIGPWMQRHRREFFLATKTEERDCQGARDSIRRSLDRMQTDHVDLIQLHNLVEEDEWTQALAPGGALEAAIEAREAGLVRFIGVTGHGTRIAAMHRRSLERFAFDSVLLPYNYTMMANPSYAADFEKLDALCRQRGVAVQTIKAVARRRWKDDDEPHFSWYEPVRDREALRRNVAWVLARAGVFLNSSSDAKILPEILAAAAAGAEKPSTTAMEADVARLEMEPLFATGERETI